MKIATSVTKMSQVNEFSPRRRLRWWDPSGIQTHPQLGSERDPSPQWVLDGSLMVSRAFDSASPLPRRLWARMQTRTRSRPNLTSVNHNAPRRAPLPSPDPPHDRIIRVVHARRVGRWGNSSDQRARVRGGA